MYATTCRVDLKANKVLDMFFCATDRQRQHGEDGNATREAELRSQRESATPGSLSEEGMRGSLADRARIAQGGLLLYVFRRGEGGTYPLTTPRPARSP